MNDGSPAGAQPTGGQPDGDNGEPVSNAGRQPTTVVLVRHARSVANGSGILAGRLPGVGLDGQGRTQADGLPQRLAGITFEALVSSPLQRCLETLAPLAAATGLSVLPDVRLAEVDYGEWSGRELKTLAREQLWATVQQYPSAAVFPGGEGLAAVAARAIAAVRDLITAHPGGRVLICSHGDVIKAVLADALGLHLDAFQRISVAPASVSVIRYTSLRPFVERIGDDGDLPGSLCDAAAAPAQNSMTSPGAPAPGAGSDAVPGGPTG